MTSPKTTLAAGAPWPHNDWPMVQDAEPASKRPKPEPLPIPLAKPEKKHYKPRVTSNQILDKLRNHIATNPGQKIFAIKTALGWSQIKTENAMTAIRAEVLNGHVLKSSLIEFKKAKT